MREWRVNRARSNLDCLAAKKGTGLGGLKLSRNASTLFYATRRQTPEHDVARVYAR